MSLSIYRSYCPCRLCPRSHAAGDCRPQKKQELISYCRFDSANTL